MLIHCTYGRYLAEGCPDVTEIVCAEPNVFMLPQLRAAGARCEAQRAAAGGKALRIVVHHGTAEQWLATEAAGGAFDACVFFLVLCSVGDPQNLVALLHDRALRPGGRLIFHEHVAPTSAIHRAVFAAMQPLWGLFGDGCQLSRNTASNVRTAAPWASFTMLWQLGGPIPHAAAEAVKA